MKKRPKKNNLIRLVLLLFVIVLLILLSITAPRRYSDVILTYGSMTITYQEAKAYSSILKRSIENSYDEADVMEDEVTENGVTKTVSEYVKEQAIEQLKRNKVLCTHAGDVALSEEECTYIEKEVASFFETEDGKALLKESEQYHTIVLSLSMQNALANKVEADIRGSAEEVTDDETNLYQYETLTFLDTDTAQKALDLIESGIPVETTASVTKGEYKVLSSYLGLVEPLNRNALKKLSVGEASSVIKRTDGTYTILVLDSIIDTDDSEKTAISNEILEQKEEEKLDEEYSKWTDGLTEKWKTTYRSYRKWSSLHL